MPYAADNQLSKNIIDGGVKVSDSEYMALLNIQTGQDADYNAFRVDGNAIKKISRNKRTVYSTDDGSTKDIADNEDTPAGYTDTARPSEWYVWDGSDWVFDDDRLEEYAGAAEARIDAHAGEVRMRFPSPGNLCAEEYMQAERAAQEYAGGGYSGDVPDEVQCWADATGMTAQGACDDILATAAGWREAIRQIRRERLVGKAAVKDAADHTAVDTASDNALAALDAITPESIAQGMA